MSETPKIPSDEACIKAAELANAAIGPSTFSSPWRPIHAREMDRLNRPRHPLFYAFALYIDETLPTAPEPEEETDVSSNIIPDDRDLARTIKNMPFKRAVVLIAEHRRKHSIFSGVYVTPSMEATIGNLLADSDAPGAKKFAEGLLDKYYLVLTTIPPEVAAQMQEEAKPTPEAPCADFAQWEQDLAKGDKYSDSELAQAMLRATKGDPKQERFKGFPIPRVKPLEKPISELSTTVTFHDDFRDKCAIEAMKIMRASGHPITNPGIAREAFELADEMVKARN